VLVLFFLFFEVAEAGAIGDRPFAIDRARRVEQGIDQGRLAAAAVAYEEDVADISSGVCGHDGTPYLQRSNQDAATWAFRRSIETGFV